MGKFIKHRRMERGNQQQGDVENERQFSAMTYSATRISIIIMM